MRTAGEAGAGSGTVLEAPVLVVGLDDLTVMGETIELGHEKTVRRSANAMSCAGLNADQKTHVRVNSRRGTAIPCSRNVLSTLGR